MDHGERAIVPLNYFLIAGTVALWAVSLPLWSTFAIALPIAIALSCIAFDKYGGMQLCLLFVVGWMAATIGAVQILKNASANDVSVSFVSLALTFVGTFVAGILGLALWMAVMVAIVLAWEWATGKLGWRRGTSRQKSGE